VIVVVAAEVQKLLQKYRAPLMGMGMDSKKALT
jgi:hypothetical protein